VPNQLLLFVSAGLVGSVPRLPAPAVVQQDL
jgi:hypothetical protein